MLITKNTKEYKIITATDHKTVEDEVNKLIKEDWQLQGGISIASNLHGLLFSQALFKLNAI